MSTQVMKTASEVLLDSTSAYGGATSTCGSWISFSLASTRGSVHSGQAGKLW